MESAKALVMVGLACLAAGALPQSALAQAGTRGLLFGGAGNGLCGCDPVAILHVGGGGEIDVTGAVAIDADIGYIAPVDAMGAGIALLSVNGLYRFGGPPTRTRPFLTGGYSLLFREGRMNAWNIGGGVDRSLSPRFGLRIEVRDHLLPRCGDVVHYIDARVGILIR